MSKECSSETGQEVGKKKGKNIVSRLHEEIKRGWKKMGAIDLKDIEELYKIILTIKDKTSKEDGKLLPIAVAYHVRIIKRELQTVDVCVSLVTFEKDLTFKAMKKAMDNLDMQLASKIHVDYEKCQKVHTNLLEYARNVYLDPARELIKKHAEKHLNFLDHLYDKYSLNES